MTQEEKAKRYDEAISIAREYDFSLTGVCAGDVIQDIFPELKEESEDERIRKALIHLISEQDGFLTEINGVSVKDIIAWLEKQGENTYNKELSELLHKVICRFINDPDIPYSDREKVSMKVLPYVERLEKQGEHANFLSKTQIGDKVTRNEDGVLVNLSQLNRVAKKQGEQKPTDKVEPKFKVGDVVTNKKSKDTVKIVQILHDSYCYSGWDGAATVHSDFSISEQDDWELVKQNSTWSEEDEVALGDALWCCKQAASIAKDENDMGNVWFAENWLKSLKEKVMSR